MNENNNRLIEEKDILTFTLKIKKMNSSKDPVKIENKTITIGKDEILPGLDNSLIGNDLSESKIFELEIPIEEKVTLFDKIILPPSTYLFSFKVQKIIKFSSREEIEMSELKTSHDDKKRIKELEEIKNALVQKVEKLEAEKQLSEELFKSKAEEMAKNAASKVEVLKEEIKNKAKEEVEHKTKFATQKLIEELLSPLNNLHVAVESGSNANDPSISAYVKGFKMLTNQIFSTLESFGVTIIEPKEGDVFDPKLHQAQEIASNPNYKNEQIIKLVSRGYMLHDRVLKPAIVVVAK